MCETVGCRLFVFFLSSLGQLAWPSNRSPAFFLNRLPWLLSFQVGEV